MAGSEGTPAGWYRQPDDPQTLRWWDGDDWTDDEMPAPSGFGGPSRRRSTPVGDRARPKVERPERERPVRLEATRPAATTETSVWQAPGAAAPRPPARPESGSSRGDRPPRTPTASRTTSASALPPEGAAPRRAAAPRADRRPDAGADPGRPIAPRPTAPRPAGSTPRPRRPEGGGSSGGAYLAGSNLRARAESSQVVARNALPSPNALRFALRVLLLAGVAAIGYIGFVQLRDAEPDKAATIADAVTPTTEPDPDAPPINEAVISLERLPSGWATQAYDPQSDDICQGRRPVSVVRPVEPLQSASFNKGAAGPFLTNVIARFRDVDTAERYLDLVGDTLEDCRVHEVDSYRVDLQPLDFPRFGDATFAVELEGEVASGTLQGYIVFLRVGDRVASIQTLGINGEDVELEQVELLAQSVARRL